MREYHHKVNGCNKLRTKTLAGIGSLAWVSGVLAAGSDGPCMPWVNGLGVLVFICASMALGRILPQLGSSCGDQTQKIPDNAVGPESIPAGSPAIPVVQAGEYRRMHSRMVLGLR